jgi:DNA-binding SARP family transcriptional activator
MALRDLVIQSQLIPPRPRKGILRRPRVQERLSSVLDYPLSLVLAGTGYGKSTALADLADTAQPFYWYSVSEPDRDPLLFLIHLISAFRRTDQPGDDYCDAAFRFLDENEGRPSPAALTPLLNALTKSLDSEAVLVIDDYHLVQDVYEVNAIVRHLITYTSPRLHIVISSRQMPEQLDLTRWRVKGQMDSIAYSELAFTAEEIEALFNQHYGFPIQLEQAQRLAVETEGWALALQLVWQSLQRGPEITLDGVLDRLPTTLESLFDYLAPEVLAHQPEELRSFLVTTSILRQLDAPACNLLLSRDDSAAVLKRLHEGGMFIDSSGHDVYRYQRLFQDFLKSQLYQDAERARDLHRRAAEYFTQAGYPEETVYHLLEADDLEIAAGMIERLGPELVHSGRLDSLIGWINRLPEALRSRHPMLELLLGDIQRLRADFDAALAHFSTAEGLYAQQKDAWGRSRALRGQAQVYLDTIRPLKADVLLEEALRLLEARDHLQEVAALLDQLAENKLNLGFPGQAENLHREARLLRTETSPNDVYLEGRRLLRTGRLIEARQLLLDQAAEERRREPSRAQRFHRETLLLLSLVCAMLGESQEAEDFAREGIEVGRRLHSEFVEAVGFMRLGHALQLNYHQPWNAHLREEAVQNYQRSIDEVHPFKVARVGVEPLWGLVRTYGYYGDLAKAEELAVRALEISEMAGDEWIGNLVRTSMGASLAMAGQYETARRWLVRSAEGFERVGDAFAWLITSAWLALNAWWSGNLTEAFEILAKILPQLGQKGYERIFSRATLLGLKDNQTAIPLLLEARQRGLEVEIINRILVDLGAFDVEYHPGFTLWVRTIGPFGVWRGDTPVSAHEWQREKARQLFELLVTLRGRWVPREELVERLWPDLPADAGAGNFKVALNALNKALEPARPRSAQPFFILRNENGYGLNPLAPVMVDADEFERLISEPDESKDSVQSLRQALALYESDYLPDCKYEDWSAPERERLRHLYLSTSGRLAHMLVKRCEWDAVISLCNATLARDNSWEPGYRYKMQAYAGKGNLPQVQSTYNRCAGTLMEELAVEPSSETRRLLKRLMGGQVVN